ncbi:glucuronate isomerase [Cellulomonas sp. ATA003]|uniref:glucuronate isomerase n=1 Tax=Cellulomonas sp. ATA003 TaxID=3073064 RepID=UPI002872D5A5|nr:glucuronate isomerase [Cellulomonas sp. ATA003]WNB87229.1 glucuronate isomerase [Cellulomonas sp. ATA003]
MPSLTLHPDRLLPADPTTRRIARKLYAAVRDLPIISPHGHVPPQWLADDVPFTDPTSLLLTPDHYMTRMLHAQGVSLADLGVGGHELTDVGRREAFRLLCTHWKAYRGTPVKFWLESELVDVFGIDVVPSAATADHIYDAIQAALSTPDFRPRALYERFGIEVLATTDDPCDDLAHHRSLAQDPSWHGRVVPTFRPDKYLEPATPAWNGLVDRLGDVAGVDTGTLAGWVRAMAERRSYFGANGAVSTDHSHRDARVEPLEPHEAERLYAAARQATVTPDEGDALRRHLMFEQARMAAEDGLVMTLHPAVRRNHHGPTAEAYGADVGADIPMAVEFTNALQPMLEAFGTAPNFQLVLFTIDETVYSRELAPLAGFYPSVYVGAPWWFIDAPDAIARYRRAVTETAGFSRTSGFIDDTRAFLSIPARHDTNRRMDSGFLAELVADHRLTMDEALETAVDLVVTCPREAFKL